ncbi:MAG: hypothetical protein NTY35_03620 [Planctomycetota bacterium]|nr:hypothetical protein [Planctomycetota bacterium]
MNFASVLPCLALVWIAACSTTREPAGRTSVHEAAVPSVRESGPEPSRTVGVPSPAAQEAQQYDAFAPRVVWIPDIQGKRSWNESAEPSPRSIPPPDLLPISVTLTQVPSPPASGQQSAGSPQESVEMQLAWIPHVHSKAFRLDLWLAELGTIDIDASGENWTSYSKDPYILPDGTRISLSQTVNARGGRLSTIPVTFSLDVNTPSRPKGLVLHTVAFYRLARGQAFVERWIGITAP